ncbi:PepSY domain-containing protein [Alsobacter soli]|uniref:PepSY domain-containing protein n=1 Tax=Alsobacter soli TaxID=2109933 RepID=A0A2T1HXI4_9HYPH|nr:PepSY domain-containing protein [Alsobacter soli]PSC06315.1 PepSY domain-containing protein [Alsobacter soli]
MRKIIPLAVAVAAGAVSSIPAAQASSLGRPCTSAPENQWLSLDALKAKVEGQGYKVQKAKLKAACGEVYALDAKGARVELFLDPTSGAIVAQD